MIVSFREQMNPSISLACSRLNGGLQKILPLVDVTLFEKWVFADVIKLRISRWNYPRLQGGGSLNVMTSVLRREEKRRWGDTEEKVTWKERLRLEWWSHKPRNVWSCQQLGEARKRPPPSLQRECEPDTTLISDFWPLELKDRKNSLVLS